MDRDKKTQRYISARRLRLLRKRRSETKGEETGSETGGGGGKGREIVTGEESVENGGEGFEDDWVGSPIREEVSSPYLLPTLDRRSMGELLGGNGAFVGTTRQVQLLIDL